MHLVGFIIRNFGVLRTVTNECGKWYSRVSQLLCYGHRVIVNYVLYFVAPDILSVFIHSKDKQGASCSSFVTYECLRHYLQEHRCARNNIVYDSSYYVFFAQTENASESCRSPLPTC